MTSKSTTVTSGHPAVLRRSIALVLVGITILPMVLLGLKVFEHGPLGRGASVTWRAVAAIIVFCCIAMSLTVLAGTVRSPSSSAGLSNRTMLVVHRMLPLSGLLLLACAVVLVHPVALSSPGRGAATVSWLVLWFGLAVAAVYVVRRGNRPPDGVPDLDGAAKVAVPVLLLLAVSLLAATFSQSAQIASALPGIGLIFAALASIAAIPAVSVGAAVAGLEAARDRGSRVVRVLRERPRFVVAVALGKVVVIIAVWIAWRIFRPNEIALSWTLASWLWAGGSAALVAVLFVVNTRLGLSAADHPVVSRASGILLGAALGALVLFAAAVGVLGVAFQRPFVVAGLAAVIAVGVSVRGAQRRNIRMAGYGVACVLAIGAALLPPGPPRLLMV